MIFMTNQELVITELVDIITQSRLLTMDISKKKELKIQFAYLIPKDILDSNDTDYT